MISNNINQSFQKIFSNQKRTIAENAEDGGALSLKMPRTKEQIAQDVFFPCSLFISVSPFA